jgi:hypothetical protein
MTYHRLVLLLGLALAAVAVAGTAKAASSAKSAAIPVAKDSQLHASSTVVGGARPQPTTRTVTHWSGTALDPADGVTYGFDMVGADPNNCGHNCDVTIPTDVIPLNVVIQYPGLGNVPFDGTDIVSPVLHSPIFTLNDYGSTAAATTGDTFAGGDGISTCSPANGDVCEPRGLGGPLSQHDAGNLLQLEDATMRAQFDKTGHSGYHLRLGQPTLHDPITIVVPQSQGTLLESGRGVIFADVSYSWWTARIQNLNASLGYLDPTHLPIYLVNNVLLYTGKDPDNCCVIGFHGGSELHGHGTGASNGNGNEPIQTYVWASWLQPGIFARANGGSYWALQDIDVLSHEISEWADDPFVDNGVAPWMSEAAPQYGCSSILETGDPVFGIGFAMGANTFEQGPDPDGSQSADGYYHPEDEAFLPWFVQTSPNDVSEPVQSDPSNTDDGRYTLMGDLNPFPDFSGPATGC